MKYILSVLMLLFASGTPGLAAAPRAKKPSYYRNRTQTPAKPRQAGTTYVVNAASYEPGVSPGSLALVIGTDLTSVNGTITANTNPLPTQLAGVRVSIDGIPAPIYSIAYSGGQDYIAFQTPYETQTGPGAAEVQVFDGGYQTADTFTDSFTEDPGIFVYNGNDAVAVSGTGNYLIGPDHPTHAGDIVVLYTTGLGPVSLTLDDGFAAPYSPLAYTQDPFQVLVDGENCEILFSGLAPGFAGLYQINFRVPWDAASGDLTLRITSPYATSRDAVLPVF